MQKKNIRGDDLLLSLAFPGSDYGQGLNLFHKN